MIWICDRQALAGDKTCSFGIFWGFGWDMLRPVNGSQTKKVSGACGSLVVGDAPLAFAVLTCAASSPLDLGQHWARAHLRALWGGSSDYFAHSFELHPTARGAQGGAEMGFCMFLPTDDQVYATRFCCSSFSFSIVNFQVSCGSKDLFIRMIWMICLYKKVSNMFPSDVFHQNFSS